MALYQVNISCWVESGADGDAKAAVVGPLEKALTEAQRAGGIRSEAAKILRVGKAKASEVAE